MNKLIFTSAFLAVATLLAGCAGTAIDKADQEQAVAAQPTAPAPEDFPAVDKATWKQGSFPNVDNLRAMRAGMGKDQVRNLLGHPHFSEGLWGVREWNYIFHFRTGADASYRTCQYMVRFDKASLSTGAWWKEPSCAALIETPSAAPATMARADAPAVLSTDALFRFDRSSASDILPGGRDGIKQLADKLRRGDATTSAIQVTGHTDRLGSDARNDALSRSRAETVRDLLVQSGVPAAKVQASGVGSREPVTSNCRGDRATPALIACLAPDRRVEVSTTAM